MEAVIDSLGEGKFLSPLRHRLIGKSDFRTDEHRVIYDDSMEGVRDMFERGLSPLNFEMAGPREKIFFDPAKTSAAIVTCGGLCPGLNDIIRAVVMELYHRYGVTRIFGLRYGYEGLVPRRGHVPLALRPESVSTIHTFGGTILGSSRGPQNADEMVEHLDELGIDILFIVGGDGTLRGGEKIANEIRRRGFKKSVIGIPKTIDNDIAYLDKSFGFDTAFAEAVKTVSCAHVEAVGAMNGIGLVKLMGRHSGFISCYAALAGQHVNYCLIPEVPFGLDGPSGLLETLRYRLAHRKHAVIVAAEGAGQDLMSVDGSTTDASGNTMEVNLKYIDPSYTIRSVPASAQDNAYCLRLAQNAVHAGMAGKTGMLIGQWHNTLVHLPFGLVTQGRQRVDPAGDLWQAVLECTGQPVRII
jgi:6-phosphofructokinase 1